MTPSIIYCNKKHPHERRVLIKEVSVLTLIL
nr:MAG TPA: hypothetical protein [Bacteriophage sp.]DAZ75735.1 MAG TPA: hypothetical protein [Caudoviricetes sp.]